MQPETPLIPDLGSLEEETLSVLRRFGSKRKKKSLSSRRFDDVSVRMLKVKSRSSRSLLAGVTSTNSTLIKEPRRNDAATKIQALLRGNSARIVLQGGYNSKTPEAIGIDPTERSSLRETARIQSSTRYFKDDGTATLHLRDSISNALKTKRFDSISSVLLHESRGNILSNLGNADPNHNTGKNCSLSSEYPLLFGSHNRSQLVSPITFNNQSCITQKKNIDRVDKGMISMEKNVSIRDVKYAGVENSFDTNTIKVHERKSLKPICFNCWSAKKGERCELNDEGHESDASGSNAKPFCDNWGIDSVRKSYRSEDIEADKSTSLSRLRFAKDLRRRSAISEHQSHPLFQSLSTHIFDVNSRARRKIHIRQWFESIVDCIKNGSIQGYYLVEAISMNLRMRNTLVNTKRVTLVTKEMTSQLPRPPTTGFDSDEEGVLYWRKELDSQGKIIEKEIIMLLPLPVPKSLYMPRTFTTPPPIKIIMGASQDIINSKFPINVVTHGYFGIKGFHHNQCVGGPSREIKLSQKIDTDFPPPYHGYNVMDKTIRVPKPRPESFVPPYIRNIPAPKLDYVERPLEHALDHRRIPTVMIKTGISPDDRHYYGKNRPEQTGDIEDRGFRTSDAAALPELNSDLDTRTFVPAESVVTPNVPQVSPMISTRTDLNYPFCETKAREPKIADLAHMLLKEQRKASSNKPQLITVMTKQQPGKFMRNCDPMLPLGRLRTVETRSFSFVHRRRIAMFRTEDGVPYWYDRRNGKTYWVRPLYDEELKPIAEGGVMVGNQSNSFHINVDNACDFVDARSNSRKVIMSQYENEEDKRERFRASSSSERPPSLLSHNARLSTDAGTNKIVKHLIDTKEFPSIKTGRILTRSRSQRTKPGDISISKKKLSRVPQPPSVQRYAGEIGSGRVDNPEEVASKPPSVQIVAEENGGGRVVEKSEETASKTSKHDIPNEPGTTYDAKEMKSKALVSSITAALGNVLHKFNSEQDILKLGVGLGMSLGAQGFLSLEECNLNSSTHSSIIEESKSTGGETECLEETKVSGAYELDTNEEKNDNESADAEYSELYGTEYQENEFEEEIGTIEQEGSKIREEKYSPPLDEYSDGEELGENNRCYAYDQDACANATTNDFFLDAIEARRVGQQEVAYIDSAPNLPQSKPVGRVRPRMIGKDWNAMNFDPWSTSKELLTIEFIPELLMQPSNATMYEETFHGVLFTPDASGLDSRGRTKNSEEEEKNVDMFSRMCRCIRHGNAVEFDLLFNESDWQVPIDYTDDVGNTLLMVCCQNGNKKMVKSLLRKGCEINKQNCNGHTCLHFCFGYGFNALGEYLVSKGADDSITNADGCTCYEGLTIEDVAHI